MTKQWRVVLQDPLDRPDRLDRRANRAVRDPSVRRESRESKDLPDQLDRRAHQVRKARLVLRGFPGVTENLACLEFRVSVGHPVLSDRLEFLVSPV